jgi:hypothetical protein
VSESPSQPTPESPSTERLFLVPGDRLSVPPPGGEWSLQLDSSAPKPWISEEMVESDKVGYQDIGRVTALRFRDAVHMLAESRDLGGGRWRHSFKPWTLPDVPRAAVNYPEDELNRLAFEANEAFQKRHAWTRRAMLPFVGGLPASLQFLIEDLTKLNMGNASRVNALATAMPTILLVILYYIVGPIATGFRIVVFHENWIKWLTAYLVLDCAVRLWHTSPNFAPMRNRETDEIGYLAVELPARLLELAWGRFVLKGGEGARGPGADRPS